VPLARHQLQQYGRRTLTGLKRGIEAGEAKFIVDSETTAALRATEPAQPPSVGKGVHTLRVRLIIGTKKISGPARLIHDPA
jgi:hypothetical protein